MHAEYPYRNSRKMQVLQLNQIIRPTLQKDLQNSQLGACMSNVNDHVAHEPYAWPLYISIYIDLTSRSICDVQESGNWQ